MDHVGAHTKYLSIPDLLKAEPREEGGRRFIYCEASNEVRDIQGDSVLASALGESADYYLRYGNLDLEHRSILRRQAGDMDYALHEIGVPREVKVEPNRVWTKGEIWTGEGPAAESANMFWDTLTKIRPGKRWYPSVGGKVLATEDVFDPETKGKKRLVTKVRWNNIGFSGTPVNTAVPTVSIVPFGALKKCWGAEGLDLAKALEAGAGTDSATLTGGGALRQQSLDPQIQSYWDFRDHVSRDLLAKNCGGSASAIIAHVSQKYGLQSSAAAEMTERFLADVKRGLNTQRKAQ